MMDNSELELLEAEGGSLGALDSTHKEMVANIKKKIQERNQLKEITKKQLENLHELQKKKEEASIAINNFPKNRLIATERYEEAVKEIRRLESKQIQINEILMLALSEYDNTTVLMKMAKEQVESETKLANQRLLVYKSDIKEMKQFRGELSKGKNEVAAKKDLLQRLNNFSADFKKRNSLEIFNKITSEKLRIETLNKDLKNSIEELQNKLRTTSDELSNLESSYHNEGTLMNQKIEEVNKEYNEKEQKYLLVERDLLGKIEKQIEEYNTSNTTLTNQILEKNNLINTLTQGDYSLKEQINELNKKIAELKVSKINLTESVQQVSSIKNQICLKESNIEVLNKNRDKLLTKCSYVEEENHEKTQKKLENKRKHEEIINERELLLNNSKVKEETIEKMKKNEDELESLVDETNNSISSAISKLNTENCQLDDTVRKLQQHCNDYNEQLPARTDEINYLKEIVIKKTDEIKLKLHESEQQVEHLRAQKQEWEKNLDTKMEILQELKSYFQSVEELSNKLKTVKLEHTSNLETYNIQIAELKKIEYDRLQEKVTEVEMREKNLKEEVDEVKDETSKISFEFYRVQNEMITMKNVCEKMRTNVKTFICENSVLRSYMSWLTSDSGALSSSGYSTPRGMARGGSHLSHSILRSALDKTQDIVTTIKSEQSSCEEEVQDEGDFVTQTIQKSKTASDGGSQQGGVCWESVAPPGSQGTSKAAVSSEPPPVDLDQSVISIHDSSDEKNLRSKKEKGSGSLRMPRPLQLPPRRQPIRRVKTHEGKSRKEKRAEEKGESCGGRRRQAPKNILDMVAESS